MNSVVLLFILLSIIHFLCVPIHTVLRNGKYEDNVITGVFKSYCYVQMPKEDSHLFPIPFVVINGRGTILYPNKAGMLRINSGQKFFFSCPGTNFSHSDLNTVNKLEIVCLKQLEKENKKKKFDYSDFLCKYTPLATAFKSRVKCQSGRGVVVSVGFNTGQHFISQYKVCFDTANKKSLFAWYYTRYPFIEGVHKKNARTYFNVEDVSLYGSIKLNQVYNFYIQKIIFTRLLRSAKLANKYLQNDVLHSLSRGHYAAKADFYYFFEQSATFNIANSAPQWFIVNSHEWSSFEESFRKIVKRFSSELLIVSGSFAVSTLSDNYGHPKPLFLGHSRTIPVPLFFWKMYYNQETDYGTVFISLNNPYVKVDKNVFICPNRCAIKKYPNRPRGPSDMNDGLVYCCTKRAFEKVYGFIDTSVYHKF